MPVAFLFALLLSLAACSGGERVILTADQGAESGEPELLRDIPYGSSADQRMDIYVPTTPGVQRPVIVMVHGGAWQIGDKALAAVVRNKVARWVSRGFILVSVNYRMLPDADPLQQAEDIARSLAAVQARVPSWGGDPKRIILMGHSAGAHLAALITAAPSIAGKFGVKPWLGTVALDTAALDIVQIMQRQHLRFYDRAFGSEPAYWEAVSPYYRLDPSAPPMLLVCSLHRDDSCSQARRFADRAAAMGVSVRLLPQELSHRQINAELGKPGAYTEAVEAFMKSLLH